MFDIPFTIKIVYNREEDINKDYTKIITVMATSREMAVEKVNNYEVRGLFNNIENDYIEDTLYVA